MTVTVTVTVTSGPDHNSVRPALSGSITDMNKSGYGPGRPGGHSGRTLATSLVVAAPGDGAGRAGDRTRAGPAMLSVPIYFDCHQFPGSHPGNTGQVHSAGLRGAGRGAVGVTVPHVHSTWNLIHTVTVTRTALCPGPVAVRRVPRVTRTPAGAIPPGCRHYH